MCSPVHGPESLWSRCAAVQGPVPLDSSVHGPESMCDSSVGASVGAALGGNRVDLEELKRMEELANI
eukprot:10799545-Heterocapsa_arctica.AAC.1